MPVMFGELSALTTPLSGARICALLLNCLTFSLAASLAHDPSESLLYTSCMVTWCLFFILTLLVVFIHFIQFHNLLPLSWKNLTATVAALGLLMTFAASFAWMGVGHKAHNPQKIVATAGSFLTSLAYMVEIHLIRTQTSGNQHGYMATVPGLLKALQVGGGCSALVLLGAEEHKLWKVCISAAIYGVCLIPSAGTVVVMVVDCATRSPVPFDRLLAGFSLLGVLLYTVGTVVCFVQVLETQDVYVVAETVVASLTLLAYTVDLAFSIKLLCDRNS